MSFALGSPKLDTTLWMPDQCWIEGKNCLPPATGDAVANAAQILLASFATRARYWLKCNLLFTTTCKSFPAKLHSSQSPACTGHGAIPPQLQGSAFPFIQLHESPLLSFLPSITVPLNGSTTIRCINHSQFSIICKDRLKFTYAWHKLIILCQPHQGLSSSLDI